MIMPFGRETVTLYNRREAKDENGRTHITWHRTVRPGCFWTRRVVRSVTNGHVSIGEHLACKIPESTDYLSPDEWDELDDPAGRFTLAAGDVVVKGNVPDEIGKALTENALKEKYRRHGIMTVSSAQNRAIGGAPLRQYLAQGV